jgi:hypothetical protein
MLRLECFRRQVRVESNFPRRCTPSENPNCVAPDFPQGLAVAIDRPGPKVEGTIVLGPGAAARVIDPLRGSTQCVGHATARHCGIDLV